MAEAWIKMIFGLDDYFMKYGFNEGTEANFGDVHISKAIEILTKHLEPFGIDVGQDDSGSSQHNNCRIEFKNEFQDIDADNGLDDEDTWADALSEQDKALKRDGRITRLNTIQNMKEAKKIVEAITAASKEFDEVAMDDMARVINCPDVDLPLLVGHIEEETALKILDWRLKCQK